MSFLLAQSETLPTPDVEWSLLWPLIIMSAGAILLITITSVVPRLRGNGFPASFTAGVSVLSLWSLWSVNRELGDSGRTVLAVGGAIAVDPFTMLMTAIIAVSVILVALTLDDYLRTEGLDGPEWYALLMISAVGGMLLASAEDLMVLFLGLEVLSIAIYILVSMHLRRSTSQEAGFKYFMLGALASAIFLYGIALTYGATGAISLGGIRDAYLLEGVSGSPAAASSMILAGAALMLVGFAFKVSAVPFHFWTPDVYQGAPTPIVGFMASVVKVAAFAGLLRVFLIGFGQMHEDWRLPVGALAGLTIVVGAILAIVQTDVKRMLAYSSISHAGFILIGLYAAGDPDGSVSIVGVRAVVFYLLAYSVIVAGTFAAVTIVASHGDQATSLDSFAGLSKRQPLLAGLLSVLLFAQAGVPFTAGFLAKLRVIQSAASSGGYVLAGVAMLASAIGVYLYLRIVVAMYLTETDDSEAPELDVAPAALFAVGLAVVATILVGVFPDLVKTPILEAAQSIVANR